jgi:DNA-binding phage protein
MYNKLMFGVKMKKKKHGDAKESVDMKIHGRLFKEFMKDEKYREAYCVETAMIRFVYELREEMKNKHMSYYSVAKKAGINHQALARILNGAKNAEISTLAKVCRGLGGQLSLSIVKK